MKKFYIIALAVCTAMSVSAEGTLRLPKMLRHKARTERKERKVTVKADNDIWRAKTQLVSEWDEEAGEWIPMSRYTTEYDAHGNVLLDLIDELEDDAKERVTYTYNDNDMKTSETTEVAEGEEAFQNYQRKTKEYDPIVKSLVVKNREYMWADDAWSMPGNCWDRNVTRDANGVITEVSVVLTEMDGSPVQSQYNKVGADGKISWFIFGTWSTDGPEPEFVPELECSNITWLETNGQVYDDESILGNGNRALSWTMKDFEEEEMSMDFTAEYTDKGYVMTASTTEMGMEVLTTISYDELPNGGFRAVTRATMEYLGQKMPVMYAEEHGYYDEYGLTLEESYSEGTDESDAEIMEKVVGTVEYDPAYGYPLSYVSSFLDAEEDVMVNDVRVDFSDYSNVSGLSVIESDADASVEYYTIDGKRSDASAPGLYIRRQGSKAVKILKN